MYCFKCQKTIPNTEANEQICPVCSNPTEPLAEVFERHPDLLK